MTNTQNITTMKSTMIVLATVLALVAAALLQTKAEAATTQVSSGSIEDAKPAGADLPKGSGKVVKATSQPKTQSSDGTLSSRSTTISYNGRPGSLGLYPIQASAYDYGIPETHDSRRQHQPIALLLRRPGDNHEDQDLQTGLPERNLLPVDNVVEQGLLGAGGARSDGTDARGMVPMSPDISGTATTPTFRWRGAPRAARCSLPRTSTWETAATISAWIPAISMAWRVKNVSPSPTEPGRAASDPAPSRSTPCPC